MYTLMIFKMPQLSQSHLDQKKLFLAKKTIAYVSKINKDQ